MKATYETALAGTKSIPATKRDPHVSTDGKWRSFPKVPNLLQYVIAGTYYARCKLNGKPLRASLETDVFSVAKQRLPDKLKELRLVLHVSVLRLAAKCPLIHNRSEGKS